MTMMGGLNFFLGFQVKQSANSTTICQEKFIKELLKRFHIENAKPIDTPIQTLLKLDFDEPAPSVGLSM